MVAFYPASGDANEIEGRPSGVVGVMPSTASIDSTSTIPPEQARSSRTEAWLQRGSIGVVGLLIVLAIFGALGVSMSLASETARGYSLEIRHARVSRPGLATPFGIAVSTEANEGLPAKVTVRVTTDYLAVFDENGLDPSPSSAFADEVWTHWTFDVPSGEETLEIDFDARLEPAVQARRVEGTVVLEVGGDEVVTVDISTLVMP
jgi:hypothetical protein